MPVCDIVVIGGSSGAAGPLRDILSRLSPAFGAAVFVVLHMPTAGHTGIQATLAATRTGLTLRMAEDGMPIAPGHLYFAPADRHLLVTAGTIRLGRGPRENMMRPAIDPLFRSAAASYGPRVVGVLLSGLLNDGASGLGAVRQQGGTVIIQDPDEAVASEMPLSARQAGVVDRELPASAMADVLRSLVGTPVGPAPPVPADLHLEIDIAAGERIDSQALARIAAPTGLTCPSCGGVLSDIDGAKPPRLRCQVGHAFSADVLAEQQEGAVDEALRVALRIIEERANLLDRMADAARDSDGGTLGDLYGARADDYRRQADVIRRAVLRAFDEDAGRSRDPGGAT